MKILLVSDKEEKYIWDYFDRERFEDIDLVVSCGDLKAEYLSFLVTMIPKPLYYVPGNHNRTYLTNPPEGCESIDGKLITYNGIRILGLGGSQRYNMGPYQYTEKEMQVRIRKLRHVIRKNRGFDILVSHAPAFGLGDGKDLCHRGFKSFIYLLDKYSPKYFFYGHKHLISNLEPRIRQYKKTTVINAYGYYILEF
jgi:uncharacterized protein